MLLKDDKDRFFGRVLEIPQVIVQGDSKEAIEEFIKTLTLDYLQAAPEIHQSAIDGKLYPKYMPAEPCVIVAIKPFTVKC